MTAPEPSGAATVLLVDDEVRSLDAMRRTLDEEFRVHTAIDAEHARGVLERHAVDVILCDQRMPGQSGVEFLKEARERWPDAVRVIVSGYADSQDIVAGVNEAGIYQYLLKPWVPEQLLGVVRGAVEGRRLHRGLQRLELDLRTGPQVLRVRHGSRLDEARARFGFDRIERAPGSPLDAVCAMAARVARHDLAVLVLGESGTGKELLARAIHYASRRAEAPFVVENCAAIPDTLIESELFGHKRGAFTGAHEDHVGLFQRATGGTLFLDEIGETSPAFQVRLLRALQEGEVRPVGATRTVAVDVRVVAATHRPLEEEVRAGRFREDLYYRLAGITLQMPALRERPGDIGAIAERLRTEVAAELGVGPVRFERDLLPALLAYPWPGNIRELRNEIARAIALAEGPGMARGVAGSDARGETVVGARLLSARVLRGQTGRHDAAPSAALPATGTLDERLMAIEAMVLRETLTRLRWNRTRVAEELGLSRPGLRAKMQRHGLDDPKP